MKFTLLTLLTIASVNSALACSQAPYPFMSQQSRLSFIMTSEKFTNALISIGGDRIKSMTMDKQGNFVFKTEGNCFVKAAVVFKIPKDGGMCPSMVDVTTVTGCDG